METVHVPMGESAGGVEEGVGVGDGGGVDVGVGEELDANEGEGEGEGVAGQEMRLIV